MFERLHSWRAAHISPRQMTLILSFTIGVLASVAAFILHSIIHEIQILLTGSMRANSSNWLFLIFPIVGIYLTYLFIKYVVRDNISHGITRVLYAIATKQSHLRAHNCWSSVVASGLTIGFGGCRSSHCTHRVGHRQQSRPAVQDGQQDADAPRGVWCRGCHCRHLQGPHRRSGVYPRSADGRSHHGFAAPNPHLLCHGHCVFGDLHGQLLSFRFHTHQWLAVRAHATLHPPRRVLCIYRTLLHAGHDSLRGHVCQDGQAPLPPAGMRRADVKHAHLPFPVALR